MRHASVQEVKVFFLNQSHVACAAKERLYMDWLHFTAGKDLITSHLEHLGTTVSKNKIISLVTEIWRFSLLSSFSYWLYFRLLVSLMVSGTFFSRNLVIFLCILLEAIAIAGAISANENILIFLGSFRRMQWNRNWERVRFAFHAKTRVFSKQSVKYIPLFMFRRMVSAKF